MSPAPGTKVHRYTEAEFQAIARGQFIEGVDRRSQQAAYERYLERQQFGRKKNCRREPTAWEVLDQSYSYSKGQWV